MSTHLWYINSTLFKPTIYIITQQWYYQTQHVLEVYQLY